MKRAVAVVIGLLAVLLTSSTAFAVYGDGGPPTIGSSSAAPLAGGPITFTISNVCPDTPVTFAIGETVVGTSTADATGSASISTTAPTVPGTYVVTGTAVGTGPCAIVASMSVVVQPLPNVVLPDTGGTEPGANVPGAAPAAGTDPNITLPATGGGGTMPGLRIGATALIVGLGLVGGAKLRRRSRQHAS